MHVILCKREQVREENKGPTLLEVLEAMLSEFGSMRKLLRRQALLMEEVRDRLSEEMKASPAEPISDGLMRLASAFFHLQRSVREQAGFSVKRREAFDLYWLQLDHLLAVNGIQVIREDGIPFDPRRHQAVVSHAPGCPNPRVVEVLQPGFTEYSRVKVPAKVIVGPSEMNPQEAWGESIL